MDKRLERRIAYRMTSIILASLIAGATLTSCAAEANSGISSESEVSYTARLLKNNFASSEFSYLRSLIMSTSSTASPIENSSSNVTKADDGVIYLLGNEIYTSSSDGVSINGSNVTITKSGEYSFKGTLDDGKIIVAAENEDDEVTINLSGVTITNSSTSPFEANSGKVKLVLSDGTRNTFKDSEVSDKKGCIVSKEDLTVSGTGTLSVYGNTKNGISCDADVKVSGGCTVYVNAVDNGIKGDNSVTIKNTTLTIISTGDGIKTDSAEKSDKGFVSIENGTTKINSASDGIQADHSVSITDGSLEIVSEGDGIKVDDGNVTIDGGSIDIQSTKDGIQAGNYSDEESVIAQTTDTQETAEASETSTESSIIINGGSISIVSGKGSANAVKSSNAYGDFRGDRGQMARPDTNTAQTASTAAATASTQTTASAKGLKASSLITINGGEITVDSADDAIHSEDKAEIYGGKLTISSGDDAIHAETVLTLGQTASDGAEIKVETCYEGFEAGEIYINSGNFSIVSSDDGINASGGSNMSQNGGFPDMGTMGGMQGGQMTPPDGTNGALPTDTNRPSRGQRPQNMASGTELETTAQGTALKAGTGNAGTRPEQGAQDFGNRGGFGSSDNSYLEINGGYIFIKAGGDGVDSNGKLAVNGGTVIVNGPTGGGNGALDYGSSFTLNGGEIIAMGSSQWARETIPTEANQTYISSNVNVSANSAVALYNSDGKLLYAFKSQNSFTYLMLTSSELVKGQTYTLKTGVTIQGDEVNGVYDAQSCKVSGGTEITVTAN